MITLENAKINEIDYAIRGNANLGIKETGKTYGAMWFAERLLDANIPIVAIDPSGVWRYLKVPRPGKQGYPVVVVGDNADIPLNPDTAGSIMRAAMESGVSLVFDLFSKHLSKSDWRKIVKEVCEVLLFENQEYGLRHLFLEEAKEYVPQQVYDKLVFSAVEKLIRIGGNSQVGITLINQRAEGLNKDVLELCAALLLYKQVGRNSITNLEKWLKKVDIENQDEIIKSLFTLPKGQCWFFDEDSRTPVLIKIPEKNTVHPDRRQMTGANVNKNPVDVSAFVKRLNQSLEKQTKADEKTPAARKDTAPVGKVEKSHLADQERLALIRENYDLKDELANAQNEIKRLQDELNEARAIAISVDEKFAAVKELLEPQYTTLRNLFENITVSASNGTLPVADSTKYDIWFPKLTGYQKDMLSALIQHRRLTPEKMGLLIGRSVRNNETFGRYIRELVKLGLIRKDGEELVLQEI